MTADADPVEARAEDARLIAGVLAGDERAFREMYRAHARGLHLLALRLTRGLQADAEDVLQEAWHRAVRSLPGFEARSSLRTWLASIVVRCALEKNRANGRGSSATPLDVPSRSEERSEEGRASRRLDLERAFERLPEGFRTVLVLHDLEGYRHCDIADLLGVSEGTSKSQLSRARGRMRELLGEDYARD